MTEEERRERDLQEALNAAKAPHSGPWNWPKVAEILAAEVHRLQRIIDGYDRTPAEARAKAAELERDEYRRKYEHYRDNENRLLQSVEVELARLKSAMADRDSHVQQMSATARDQINAQLRQQGRRW